MSRAPSWVRVVGVVMLLAVATASCSGDEPAATLPPPTTTTSTIASIAEIPDEIDVAYVQRVMDTLDQVLGDAIRARAAAAGPTAEFKALLDAVHDDEAFASARHGLRPRHRSIGCGNRQATPRRRS